MMQVKWQVVIVVVIVVSSNMSLSSDCSVGLGLGEGTIYMPSAFTCSFALIRCWQLILRHEHVFASIF